MEGAHGLENHNLLRVLSQYRLNCIQNMELQFEIAFRDQIISERENVIDNLWRVLQATG